jgi:hypothetical protein
MGRQWHAHVPPYVIPAEAGIQLPRAVPMAKVTQRSHYGAQDERGAVALAEIEQVLAEANRS